MVSNAQLGEGEHHLGNYKMMDQSYNIEIPVSGVPEMRGWVVGCSDKASWEKVMIPELSLKR